MSGYVEKNDIILPRIIYIEGSIAAIWYLGQATFLVLFKLSMSSVKLRPMVIQGLMGLFTGFSS